MNDQEVDKLLKKYHYDVNSPAAYSGVDKLYRIVNIKKKIIGRYRILKWFNSQDSYSLQKTPRRTFKRSKVLVGGLDHQWDCDLMQLNRNSISWDNDGINYVLVAIDVLSKYVWLQPLKKKTGKEVTQAFKNIFAQGRVPQRIRSDKGQEFNSKLTKTLFKEFGIHHFFTQNELHASVLERCIQTIRNKLFRYFTDKRTYRYIDKLQSFAYSYNNTPHR